MLTSIDAKCRLPATNRISACICHPQFDPHHSVRTLLVVVDAHNTAWHCYRSLYSFYNRSPIPSDRSCQLPDFPPPALIFFVVLLLVRDAPRGVVPVFLLSAGVFWNFLQTSLSCCLTLSFVISMPVCVCVLGADVCGCLHVSLIRSVVHICSDTPLT